MVGSRTLAALALTVGFTIIIWARDGRGEDCPYAFETIDFGCPGAVYAQGWGLNNSGLIVGEYDDGGSTHGFLYNSTACVTLDYPGAVETIAQNINDSSTIVGSYCDWGGTCHSWWFDTSFHEIRFPGAISTSVQGINHAGLVVGEYEDPAEHVFTYSIPNDTYSAAGALDCSGAYYNGGDGINDSGVIAADLAFTESGPEHEYTMTISNPGTCTTWDFPGASSTGGEDINNAGVSVGVYTVGGVEHGYLHDGSFACTLDFPGASGSVGEDLNDFGVVLGSYSADGFERSFIATPIPQVPILNSWGATALVLALLGVGGLQTWIRAERMDKRVHAKVR